MSGHYTVRSGWMHPSFVPGRTLLLLHLFQVASVSLERKARPQFVLLSSAAVERSARAQMPEERESSIPIVKLNPCKRCAPGCTSCPSTPCGQVLAL